MAIVKLDSKVKGAILITVGDTDKDGKIGTKVKIFGDIPLDGTSEPKMLVDLPEWEPVDVNDLPNALNDVMKFAGPIISGLMGFLKKK